MTVRVLTGSKQEIVREVAGIAGDIREAILFIDEQTTQEGLPSAAILEDMTVDLFAEMDPYAAQVQSFDDSRAAIYGRLGDE